MTYRQRNIPVTSKEESEAQTDIRYTRPHHLDSSRITLWTCKIKKGKGEPKKPPSNFQKSMEPQDFSDPSETITFSKNSQREFKNLKICPMTKKFSGKD